MHRTYNLFLIGLSLVLFTSPWATAQNQTDRCPLKFRVTLARETAPAGASGRLLVFMSDSPEPHETLGVGFIASATWVAAMEVEHISSGQTIEFDPDVQAYPRPFSRAAAGNYQFMALLDQDHSYPYSGQDEDDIYSPVARVENLNPARAVPVELTLSRRTQARRKAEETENIKLGVFQSPLLSAFWGRPITMRAGVVLPPGYAGNAGEHYPAVYHVHGFGDDYREAWTEAGTLITSMAEGKHLKMVHVFLDGSWATGHHEFADSVNNGPWGRALTEEFIPFLEKRFRLIASPYARFLTGHSSGGWSTLWLQITYPDFFGGTWSTSPDPVDLHSFTGIDVTPGSTENAYRARDGKPRNLVRIGGKDVESLEQFAKLEEVLGPYGGQFASFEWVWSPRGPDGRPKKLFNRETGDLDPEVQRAWQKYDIRLILEKNWSRLEPKLRGKINVICGGADTFHLNEAVTLLCDFLKRKGSDAVCEIAGGRDHFDLYLPYATYPEGLAERIAKEMQSKFEEKGGAKRTRRAGRRGRAPGSPPEHARPSHPEKKVIGRVREGRAFPTY